MWFDHLELRLTLQPHSALRGSSMLGDGLCADSALQRGTPILLAKLAISELASSPRLGLGKGSTLEKLPPYDPRIWCNTALPPWYEEAPT